MCFLGLNVWWTFYSLSIMRQVNVRNTVALKNHMTCSASIFTNIFILQIFKIESSYSKFISTLVFKKIVKKKSWNHSRLGEKTRQNVIAVIWRKNYQKFEVTQSARFGKYLGSGRLYEHRLAISKKKKKLFFVLTRHCRYNHICN